MKIHKKCTTLMLVLILSIQTVPVLASSSTGQSGTTARISTSGVEDLTVAQATQRAIANSSAIRDIQDRSILSREKEDQLRDQLFSPSNNMASLINTSSQLMASELARALNLDNIEAQRSTLGYIITNQFSNIIMGEKALEAYDSNISILERELEISRIKTEIGTQSQMAHELVRANLERAINGRVSLVNSINESYRTLNRHMGVPLDRRYNLIFDAEYEELGEVDLTRHINNHRRNNIAIQTAQNNLNVQQYQLDNFVTPIDMNTGAILSNETREQRLINVNLAAREVNNARERVEDTILALYSRIRNLEASIQSYLLDLEDLERELEVLYTRFRLGKVTALEIDRHKLKIIRQEQTIMTNQLNHRSLVMRFNNPNISV